MQPHFRPSTILEPQQIPNVPALRTFTFCRLVSGRRGCQTLSLLLSSSSLSTERPRWVQLLTKMTDETDGPPTPKSPYGPDTLKDVTGLARFEFEPGKSNEGTKILMVEWQDSHGGRQKTGSWQVSWSGKRTTFSADDSPSDNVRRVYFLLPPGSAVPPHVTLAYYASTDSRRSQEPLKMTVYPLPAIFTPQLGATVKASGKKGVLHTIWAKKRLQILDKEIKHETEYNLEGIALEMATAEREWIQSSFGLQVKIPSIDTSAVPRSPDGPTSPGLQSPKSPRLSEKLRGLSIGTSEKDLARVNTPTSELHPLSPEVGDMAYSSFSSFRPGPASPKSAGPRRIVAQRPPQSIRNQQASADGDRLDFVAKSETNSTDDGGLFAVALSPRTPDIPKSPFSFSSTDVAASRSQEE